jgi:FkbM family methyltransferase
MKNIWERAVVLPLKFFLQPGTTLVDLGSNIGEVASSIYKGSDGVYLVAVEANPDLIPRIRETLSKNSIVNYEIHNKAAWSDSNSLLTLSIDESPYSTSSSIYEVNPYSKLIEVSSIAVDDLSHNWPKVSVIKVDVEGAEFEALLGCKVTILRDHPVVTYERTKGNKSVDEFLKSLNYKLYLSNTLDLLTWHNSGDENGIYNILAIPETIQLEIRKEFGWYGLISPRLKPGLYVTHVELNPNFTCSNGVGVWNLKEGYWETAYVTDMRSLSHFTNSTLLFDIESTAEVEIRMTETCKHDHIVNCFAEKIDLKLNRRNYRISYPLARRFEFFKAIFRSIRKFN